MRQRPSHTLAFSHPPGSFSRFLRLFCSHALYLLANDWIQSPASASGKSSVCLRKPQDSALFYCFRIFSSLIFPPPPSQFDFFSPWCPSFSLQSLNTTKPIPASTSLSARSLLSPWSLFSSSLGRCARSSSARLPPLCVLSPRLPVPA